MLKKVYNCDATHVIVSIPHCDYQIRTKSEAEAAEAMLLCTYDYRFEQNK